MIRSLLTALAIVVGLGTVQAGGPPPMYVVVDEVVVEPAKGDPELVIIRGVFARLKDGKGVEYAAPVEGAIHLSLNKDQSAEWEKELKAWSKAAGTGKVVPVGMCGDAGTFLAVKIRKVDERPKTADAAYTPGHVGETETKSGKQTWDDMEPVKALQTLVKERKSAKDVKETKRK